MNILFIENFLLFNLNYYILNILDFYVNLNLTLFNLIY